MCAAGTPASCSETALWRPGAALALEHNRDGISWTSTTSLRRAHASRAEIGRNDWAAPEPVTGISWGCSSRFSGCCENCLMSAIRKASSCAFALHVLGIGSAGLAAQLIEVQVADVSSAALLTEVASLTRLNVLFSPLTSSLRISVSGQGESADEILALIAQKAGLRTTKSGPFTLVGAPCSMPIASSGSASLQDPDSTSKPKCEAPHVNRELTPPKGADKFPSHWCPYRKISSDPMRRQCQPLEAFGLHTLAFKGFVRIDGNYKALVESPDGRLHILRQGDFLGRNLGSVSKIGSAGLIVNELVHDDKGDWYERIHTISYGERSPVDKWSRERSYIEPGSPQHHYEFALGQLATTVHWLPLRVEYCARTLPEFGQDLRTALENWQRRNAPLLHEVEQHVEALERIELEDGVPVDELATSRLTRHLEQHITTLAAVRDPDALNSKTTACSLLLGRLESTRPSFDPTQLMTLRLCGEAGVCRSLAASGFVR